MSYIEKRLVLDVARKNLPLTVMAKQYDLNSRFLRIELKSDGKPLIVDDSNIVTINAKRADGQAKSFCGSVNNDGTVTVPITNWMMKIDEKVKCDVSVIDGASERKLTTMEFNLLVDTAANPTDKIDEDDKYDILVSLISEWNQAKDECEKATTTANEAAERAEQASKAAGESINNADKASDSAREAAELAETAAGEANDAADKANDAASAADTAKREADNAAAAANEAAQTVNAAVENANKTAEELSEKIGKLIIQDIDTETNYIAEMVIVGGHPALELTELKEE